MKTNSVLNWNEQSLQIFEGVQMAAKKKTKPKSNGMPSPAPKKKKRK